MPIRNGLMIIVLIALCRDAAADDIDIYRHSSGTQPAVRRVMLALDTRSAEVVPACADASTVACTQYLGPQIRAELDLYSVTRDRSGDTIVAARADGVADTLQDDPASAGQSLAQTRWRGATVGWQAVLRAAIVAGLSLTADRLRDVSAHTRVEVGLMLAHGDDCQGAGPSLLPDYTQSLPQACSQGAYILQGFTDLRDPTGVAQLSNRLAAIPEPGTQTAWMSQPWQGHHYKLRDIYLELYRYLTGGLAFSAYLGAHDFGSQLAGNLYHDDTGAVRNDVLYTPAGQWRQRAMLSPDTRVFAPQSLDLARNNVAAARYLQPTANAGYCTVNRLVHILFSRPTGSDGDTNEALAAPVTAGGLGLGAVPAGADGDALVVNALRGPLYGGEVGTAATDSFFISADRGFDLAMLARAGGTGNTLVYGTPAQLLAQVNRVLFPLATPAVTFASGVIAGTGDTVSGTGDALYITQFEPRPGYIWPGNIKKLKLSDATRFPRIVVQAPQSRPPRPALSDVDGQILADALTFWTDPGGADVLAHDPARDEVAGRDGRSVTRGGAGQRIPGMLAGTVGESNSVSGGRRLFTQDPVGPGVLLPLDVAQAENPALLPYLDPRNQFGAAGRADALRWLRGMDVHDEDNDGNRQETRSWLLGGVLHSRPLVISYGVRPGAGYGPANPERRLVFGSTDGFVHMLEDTSAGLVGAESGSETWAFMPLELLSAKVGQAAGMAGASGFYGMDGSPVAMIDDRDGDGNIEADDGDEVWVYIGQRRGGRALYAFDMTDPDNISLKWKLTPQSPGFAQLAMTFSTPRVARLDLGRRGLTPVLIFAGGYNGSTPGTAGSGKDAGAMADTTGNAVYVVDAETGSLIWQAVGPDGSASSAQNTDERRQFIADLTDSIPSALTLADSNGNGIVDRAYVGDSGGNVWRIRLTEARHARPGTAPTAAANWSMEKLASLGGTAENDRRFFHAPDFVRSRDATGEYDGVLLVSGNRAAPLATQVTNFAYFIKDRSAGARGNALPQPSPAVMSHGDMTEVTGQCLSELDPGCLSADLVQGWRLALSAPGEKGLSSAVTSNGVVSFTTYIPASASGARGCAVDQGHGRLYQLKLRDAAGAIATTAIDPLLGPDRYSQLGAGVPAGPIPTNGGLLLPGATGAQPTVRPVPGRSLWRIYWRQEGVDGQ